MTSKPELSFVVPLLNEEGSIEALHGQLTQVLSQLGRSYEMVFVNDGSTDRSAAILERIAERDGRVGVIHLRRRFGKATALDVGFRAVQGDLVFTMDGDLQDEPSEVPRLLAKIEEGWDAVSGVKHERKDPLSKTLPSKLFNFVVGRVSGLRLHDFNCGFKVYRREALLGLPLYGELHRYVPVLLHWRGFRVGETKVRHNPRTSGQSKYGFARLLHGFLDLLTVVLITRFRSRPLHLFGLLGALMGALGFLCLAYLATLWFLGLGPIGARPLMTLGVLLMLVGTQLVSVGLLGEMITHTRPPGTEPTHVIRSLSLPGSRNEQPSEVPNAKPPHAANHRAIPASGDRAYQPPPP